MAPKVYDRVKEYTVSTGIGGITFVGSFNGFQRFSDVLSTGETTYYVIEENDKWEVGIGTYGSNNLDRTTVLASSNGGNKVSLNGSGVVSITYPAGKAVFSDEFDYVSGVAVYASGHLGAGVSGITQAELDAVEDIAVYSSGQSLQNQTDIAYVSGIAVYASGNSGGGAAYDDTYVSGVSTYASGQVISNQLDISTNSNNISYVSGVANYASGQAVANESDIATNTSSISTNTGRVNYASGLAITNELNVAYASGQAIANEADIATNSSDISTNTSNISTNTARVNYASGQAIANELDIATNTSNISTNTSRVAYASGQAIENESQISSVSGWASVYADAGDASVSGWADVTFVKTDDDTYVSGIAAYASGNTSNISFGSNAEGDMLYHDGTKFVRLPKGNNDYVLKMNGNVPNWEAESAGGGVSAADLEYVSGIAVYASGEAGSGGSYDDTYVSGVATYASGQAIENEADILYVSGIAVYASGNTLQRVTDNGASTTNAITITDNNITASSGLFDALDMTPLGNGSTPAYQEGVIFYDSENHTLSLYNDEADVTHQLGQEQFLRVRNNTGATIPNGAAVLINGAHGNSAPTISGAIATTEANSQVVGVATHSIETDSFGYVTTYGIVRDIDTSEFSAGDEVFLSAAQIGSGVGIAPTIPNYKISLGHVINSSSVNGSMLVQVGNTKLGGGDLKSEAPLNMSGVPFVTTISDTTAGGSQTDPLFTYDDVNRQLRLASGVQLLDGTPTNTSNVLYNEGGTLKFNGSAVDTTYDDTYVSGVATYASGQAIANESDISANTSNISTNTSNISDNTAKVAYASGQAIENESDIAALLTASGTATSLIASSGIADYASGQAVSNQADISYVSGVATKRFDITAGDGTNYTIDGMGLNSASDPTIYLHKGHTYIFNKTFSGHPFRVSATDGGAVYTDADSNNIEIGSAAGFVTFEVPQNAPDKLYYYCTAHPSTMKGEIYTTTNVDDISYASGIAVYASGQAIANESDIATNTSNISDNSVKVTYASGQAIENEADIVYISGIAVYASGNSGGGSLTVRESDGSPSVSSVDTIVVSNGTLTDDGGGQVTIVTGGGGGSPLTAGSGIVIDDSDRINIYGGSGHFQNIQLETTGIEDAFLITSTDPDSEAGPVISTMRDSASPADGDYLGQLKFKGRSDTGAERVYAKITGKTLDVTNNTEDGVIELMVRADGSNKIISRFRNDGLRILNDGSLLIQDAGNVGIRNTNPSYPLDVEGDAHVASGLLVGNTLDVSGVATFDQVSTFQSGVKTNLTENVDAATITFDMDKSNVHIVTLGGNRTLDVSNVSVGQKFLIRLEQDSTGSRTVTWWNDIKWAEGGTEPTLTTTPNKADLFGFLSPSGGYYDGFVVGQNI